MANDLSLKLPENNLYSDGFILVLSDGTTQLKRNKIDYTGYTTKDEIYVVKENDTPWEIAYLKYGDSKWWFVEYKIF